MKSPCCGLELSYRKHSERKNEILSECPKCKEKWQYRNDKPFSHPYQVKKKKDSLLVKGRSVRGRMTESKYSEIATKYGSFQKFLDFFEVL